MIKLLVLQILQLTSARESIILESLHCDWKRYWNNGLGSLLLEEAIEWAQASGILRRLQLTVQTQ